MLKATWRGLGSPAWLAVALAFLIPTLAQAQLFPNRTIRRERPPCSSEPPFNAQVRRDYFGYYPTCWTRFPAGWACPCPNPELPNREKSIRDYGEFGSTRRSLEGEAGMGPGEDNPDEAGDRKRAPDAPNIPLPNDGRSPFEMDPGPRPVTPPGGDPFTNPNPPNPRPANPSGRPSAGVMEMPQLPATTPSASFESPMQPGSLALAPDATLASSTTSDVRPDLGPLPPSPVSVPSDLTSPSAAINNPPALGTPAPAQAPRRRGFLSNLFGPKDTRGR